MRKSERIRLLELQLIKIEFEIDLLNNMLITLLEANNLSQPELDAGKWYKAKLDTTDPE
jgi:hypothetical protein